MTSKEIIKHIEMNIAFNLEVADNWENDVEASQKFFDPREMAHGLRKAVEPLRQAIELIKERDRIRPVFLDALTDIRHWMSLAERQREMMDQNLGWCPTETGIRDSQAILNRAANALISSVNCEQKEPGK